jgi:hypothetical protein
MMKTHSLTSSAAGLLVLLASTLMLIGCSGNPFSYVGKEAKPENRYALEDGGPHTAEWHSADLALQYTYRIESGRLYMEGTVVPANRIKHYSQLRAWISIHMLDANGIILATHRLWSQYGNGTYGGLRWTFKKDWAHPPDNEAIGFSFSGTAGGTGENGGAWEFWQTP